MLHLAVLEGVGQIFQHRLFKARTQREIPNVDVNFGCCCLAGWFHSLGLGLESPSHGVKDMKVASRT